MAVRMFDKRNIGRLVVGIEAGVAALVLLSCGGSDPAPAPTRLQEPDAGDEQAIAVPVRIVVTDARVTVRPDTVAAFLPLKVTFHNRGSDNAYVSAPGVPTRGLQPGQSTTQRSAGVEPGRYTVRAGRGRRATLRVKDGG